MGLGRRGRPRRTGGRGDWDVTDSTPPGEHDAEVPAPRAPLVARSEPARGKPPERRTPIKPMSDRTVARLPERAAVTAPLTTCVMAWLSPCWGPIDGHEVVRRSKNSEAQYDPLLVVGVCRCHHATDVYRTKAERLGMRVPGWVWDRDGYRAVEEAARVRASKGSRLPYWLTESTFPE